MYRTFSVLITLGIIIWVFLLWQRTHPERRVEDLVEEADNANTADRCLKYRMTAADDDSLWSLGYGGRIEQLLHGCF